MKRKRRLLEDESEEEIDDESSSDCDSEDSYTSEDEPSFLFDYEKYKDKLFGETDEIDETVYEIIQDFDWEEKVDGFSDRCSDDENYHPSMFTLKLEALFESIGSGLNNFHFSKDPKERSDALRIIIEQADSYSSPFSAYIMEDCLFRETKKKKSESFIEYCNRCTTANDAKIVDFLTRCNNRFNLFDLYYGYIFFQSVNYENYSENEDYFKDEEEIEKVKIIDLYHSSGKFFAKELQVKKIGDVFSENSFGNGKMLSNQDEKIEVSVAICMVIVPKHQC